MMIYIIIIVAIIVISLFIISTRILLKKHKSSLGFSIENGDGYIRIVNNDNVSFGYKLSKIRRVLAWKFYRGVVYFDNSSMKDGDTSWTVAKCNFDGKGFNFSSFEVITERN